MRPPPVMFIPPVPERGSSIEPPWNSKALPLLTSEPVPSPLLTKPLFLMVIVPVRVWALRISKIELSTVTLPPVAPKVPLSTT